MSAAIAGPEAENKRQSRYAWWLLAIIALALLATAYIAQDRYAHPTRPSDCDVATDYAATCARATAPAPAPGPGQVALYLGTLAAAALAILLVQAGWSASVTKQAEILTAFAGTAAPPPGGVAPQGLTPAAPKRAAPPHPIAGKDDAALARPSPTAIRENRIVPGMIAPPKAEPRKGVDPKKVGGAK